MITRYCDHCGQSHHDLPCTRTYSPIAGIDWRIEELPNGAIVIYDADGHAIYQTGRDTLVESLCTVLCEGLEVRDRLERVMREVRGTTGIVGEWARGSAH